MKETRLPMNLKEGIIYGAIIASISVFVMVTFNMSIEQGSLSLNVILSVLKILPFMIIFMMLVNIFIVGRIVEKLLPKFIEPSDGFNARILFSILFSVTILSISMTIIGNYFSQLTLNFEPFLHFFENWPRNFCVAFWCEALLAQPLARFAMKKIHQHQDSTLPLHI